MSILFSPSTCGFYDTTVNKSIPSDSVVITDSERSNLLNKQAQGFLIDLNDEGLPVAKDI